MTSASSEQIYCFKCRGKTDTLDSFVLRGSTAVLAGKPDLVPTLDNEALAVDMKVGLPNAANTAQQMLSSRQPQTADGQ